MSRIIYLSDSENLALNFLSEDKSYVYVRNQLEMDTTRFASLLHSIRLKTGVDDLQDGENVRDYIRFYESAPKTLDDQQLYFLKNVCNFDGATPQAAAYTAKIPLENSDAYFREILNRLGISTKCKRKQRIQCRQWLAATLISISKGAQPLTNDMRAALKMYSGESRMHIWEIADKMGKSELTVDYLVRDGLLRLGVHAKGRGVQRNLAAIALRALEEKERKSSITMDDPAF